MERFKKIPIPPNLKTEDKFFLLRINCLGSLFYFIQVGLRRRKLTEHLHAPLCNHLESDHIKDVVEWPRDHYKTTIASEGLPIWRVLPFTSKDEDFFRKIGYGDEFIRFQKRKHDPDKRNLLVSENATNAAKLGHRTRWHFESNALFRTLFPDILPDSSCRWTDLSLVIKRTVGGTGGGHGEGTFDFLGVKGALHSRHYNGLLVQDDLVGRKAIQSTSLMEDTIQYHQLLPGAFDSEDKEHENDELVIGNRWGYYDLNAHIKKMEPWFKFTTHSALGGCCPVHPPDTVIFPEEFTHKKLMQIKERQGIYTFSCQFLNNPAAPEDADFKEEWLRYFSYRTTPGGDRYIEHRVQDGFVKKDINPESLVKTMVVDPNHSGNAAHGRCRHAILVVGTNGLGDYYLLESWLAAATYDTFYDKIYELAHKHKIRKVGFETVAAQKYAAHHIQWRNSYEEWPVKIVELKGEVEAPDGTMTRNKEWRIRNVLSPIAEEGHLWVQSNHQLDFINEFITFPHGQYVDGLDAFAYAPQMLSKAVFRDPYSEQVLLNNNLKQAREVNRPYTLN